MDGIFIAFHNTSQIFGFQYMSLADMDKGLFAPKYDGDSVFKMCVGVLDRLMPVLKECHPNEVCTIYWHCLWRSLLLIGSLHPSQDSALVFDNDVDGSGLRIWVEPVHWDSAKGPAPVTEFVVQVQDKSLSHPYSIVGKSCESYYNLVGEPHFDETPCSIGDLDYSIIRYNPSEATRAALTDAHARRAAVGQPLGSHTQTSEEQNVTERSTLAKAPSNDRVIQRLRTLARKGRIHTDTLKKLQQGKAIQMWDQLITQGSS